MTKIIESIKRSFANHSVFEICWFAINSLAIAIVVTAAIFFLCAFSFGTGLNAPIDIHIPIDEELADMIE